MVDRENVVARLRAINPDNVIMAVLFFLNSEFTSDSAKLHTGIRMLREKEDYGGLLEDFVFVDAYPFPYSPLLERVLQRLQECMLIRWKALEPIFEISKRAKRAVEKGLLPKFNEEQQRQLKSMAEELKPILA